MPDGLLLIYRKRLGELPEITAGVVVRQIVLERNLWADRMRADNHSSVSTQLNQLLSLGFDPFLRSVYACPKRSSTGAATGNLKMRRPP